MGPQQARHRSQQQVCVDTYNHHTKPLSAEQDFEFDTSEMVLQQNYHPSNTRPILPYPEPRAMPDSTMPGSTQNSYIPFDFTATSQEWQSPYGSGSYYYPPPPHLLPVDDEYTLSYPVHPFTHPERNNAGIPAVVEPISSINYYRPIAPAPSAPASAHLTHYNRHVANTAPGPHSYHPPPDRAARYPTATEEAVDLRDHEWDHTGKSVFPDEVFFENGRTYQAYRADAYYFPNDPQEQDRLDFQHEVYKIMMGGRLYVAPIRNPRNVLDLGTGTGIWANEIAAEFPDALVTGTDLTLIQPTNRRLPPNVSFIKEDAEEDEWSIPTNFDYIHVREVYMSIKDHMKFLRNIYKHLAPGGWVEVQDIRVAFFSDDGSSEGSALERHCQLVLRGLTVLGRNVGALERYRSMLAEVGFTTASIHELVLPWPCSGWSSEPQHRKAGEWSATNMYQVARSVTYRLLQAAGVSARENRDLAEEIKRELYNKRVRGYWPFHIIYAQKPW
ncbi:methyltransferase [Apiospora arundinis]